MTLIYQKKLHSGLFELWTQKPNFNFNHVTQVHGIDIVSSLTLPCEADGIVSSWEEFTTPIAIKTADCMPVVIEGKNGVIFLHAGWRGLASGILSQAAVEMISPEFVFIGPSIHSCCFEVSNDFKDNFKASTFFTDKGGKTYFDLQKEAEHILTTKYRGISVEIAPECTCCDHRFFSYRRNKTTERNWNIYKKGN